MTEGSSLSEPDDTIAARATPAGRGGVSVIRVSGPSVPTVAGALLAGPLPAPRWATYRRFLDADGDCLDEGIAVYFQGPASFTGEDVLELHGHGGEILVSRLLTRLTALGVRAAEPGEFSRRAFINGRLDLSQAEAIADLIDARSEAAARAAMRSLQGEFGQTVQRLVDNTTQLRVHVEATIDFPDDDIDLATDSGIRDRLAMLTRTLDDTLATARRGRTLREGMQVVIVGRPNVGKSSLLNQLAGESSAIVTELAGTTRDTLREELLIGGMPLQVIDTAGLRDSGDPIEQEGVRRAWQAINQCDRVLLVTDASEPTKSTETSLISELPDGIGLTILRNKADLVGAATGLDATAEPPCIQISASTGDGLDALRSHLCEVMGVGEGGGEYSARQRHVDALERARCHLAAAGRHAEAQAGELMAEELASVQATLGEITGHVSSDDLLGHIFSTFCIGK